jgi:hypothetical protein
MVDNIVSHSVEIQEQELKINRLDKQVKILEGESTTLRTEVAALKSENTTLQV